MGSHAEEKSQTGYRGIGGQRGQSPQEDWVLMGERARGENRRRRNIAHHPVCTRQAAREWRLRQAANRKEAKDLEKLPNVNSILEEKDADEESNPGRCGPHTPTTVHVPPSEVVRDLAVSARDRILGLFRSDLRPQPLTGHDVMFLCCCSSSSFVWPVAQRCTLDTLRA